MRRLLGILVLVVALTIATAIPAFANGTDESDGDNNNHDVSAGTDEADGDDDDDDGGGGADEGNGQNNDG